MTPPTPEEQDSSLAAMIGTVADGRAVTALDKAMLRLTLVKQAKDRGLSWAAIGALYGVSGREMKRDARALDRRVRRGPDDRPAERLGSGHGLRAPDRR